MALARGWRALFEKNTLFLFTNRVAKLPDCIAVEHGCEKGAGCAVPPPTHLATHNARSGKRNSKGDWASFIQCFDAKCAMSGQMSPVTTSLR